MENWSVPQSRKIYNFVKTTDKIKHISNINITAALLTSNGREEIDFEKAANLPFVIPVSGDMK